MAQKRKQQRAANNPVTAAAAASQVSSCKVKTNIGKFVDSIQQCHRLRPQADSDHAHTQQHQAIS